MIPYFDLHNDTIGPLMRGESLKNGNTHINLENISAYSPCALVFALFADVKKNRYDTFIFDKMITKFRKEIKKNSDTVMQCFNASDWQCAKSNGKTAVFLAIEGAELISCDQTRLVEVYNAGVRDIMLTWNYENELSGSCLEGAEKGLTSKGKKFAEDAMELGIMLDVSHLSDAGFYDIFELAERKKRPFIASHSNSRSICKHPRNITDDMFKKIKLCGGVVGINLYAPFLSEDKKCSVDNVIKHIEHFCALGGEKILALGCDFDGCDNLPNEINSAQDLYILYNELAKKNYSEKTINDIFYCNSEKIWF